MASITVFGIPNCDTVKKARKWLDANDISYEFHDYKKKGIDKKTLKSWCKELGWDALLNRRGTTWRKLDESDKADVNETRAVDLMVEHTSMIKRPVIAHDGGLLLGFDEAHYRETLA
ncbi:MAG: ArsC family reductase [Granulosicoccus sp.]